MTIIQASSVNGQETVPVSVTLEINQTQSIGTACYVLGPNSGNTQSWEEETDYSGSLTFNANLNPSSAALSDVVFTSGEITTDGFSGSENIVVGGKRGLFTYSFGDVVRTVNSTIPDTPSSNKLNHARHGSIITRGSMSSSHLIFGEQGFANQTINLATTSDVLVKDETIFGVVNSGQSTLTVQQLSGSLLSGQFRANFQTAPGAVVSGSNDFSSVPVRGSGQSYVHAYKEEGTIVASATFTAPTAFGAWATDEGLSLSTGLESNSAGISYRLLYSLDLPATATSVPMTIELDGENNISVSIDVPSRGLTFPLVVVSNEGLEGNFDPVPNSAYQSRLVKGLPAGRSRDARLIFPREDMRFFRLGVME